MFNQYYAAKFKSKIIRNQQRVLCKWACCKPCCCCCCNNAGGKADGHQELTEGRYSGPHLPLDYDDHPTSHPSHDQDDSEDCGCPESDDCHGSEGHEGFDHHGHDSRDEDIDEYTRPPLIVEKRKGLKAKGGRKNQCCNGCCVRPMTCDECLCWLERYKNLRRYELQLKKTGLFAGPRPAFHEYFPPGFNHDYKLRCCMPIHCTL